MTGAGTGIGRAIATRLAREHWRVTVMARRAAPLRAVADAMRQAGAEACHVATVDIRERAAVDEAFRAATQALGPLDAVIANAGIGGPNTAGAEDRFDDLVAANVVGTYNTVRAGERHIADGPSARHIVIMSSILARIGVTRHTGYCASKAALTGLARALAMELADDNVQVNAVCPGWVETEMSEEGLALIAENLNGTKADAFDFAMQQVPLRRMSKPEDVAGVVAWLVSPDARGVTGQSIDMNNGAFMI